MTADVPSVSRNVDAGGEETAATEHGLAIVEAWNTILFERFSRFRHVVTKGLSGHSDEVFRRRPFPRGASVLDLGCGFGDTTLAIANLVGPEGKVFGLDCARNFIDAANRDAARAQITNVKFIVADAQTESLGGPYDHAFSRFGTMFFSSPGAAMRNVRRSLSSGGTFTMIVWRRREDNGWVHEAELRTKEIVPVISHDETDQLHCGPGPFSMAEADPVTDLLTDAGFHRVTFERFDRDICIGRNLSEAVDFAMTIGPAGEILRLAGEEGVKRKDHVALALADAFRSFERSDGVWAPSSVWFITAEAT
jgi:ubiquinone/menaquinone biosynthesis C-methylase UbiE